MSESKRGTGRNRKRVVLVACLAAGAVFGPKAVKAVLLRLTGTVVRDETHGR